MIRIAALSLTFIAFLVSSVGATNLPDYFAPRDSMDADTAIALDAWSGNAAAVEKLRARLQQQPLPADAANDWSFLCSYDYNKGHYAKAAQECAEAVALDPNGGDAEKLATIKLAVKEPGHIAFGSARVPVSGGAHIPVTAGGYMGTAIADTGAEISVMMQSVAAAAHVKILGMSGKVGSTTASVTGKIGFIPEVRIGGAVVKNIPVLVLPDAQLTLIDGKTVVKLPFILSLYALADFGRIAWLDRGKTLALGSAAPPSFPGAVPMTWHPMGIAVPIDGPGGRHAAHFNSGDDVSYLFDAALPLLSDAERAQIVEGKRKIGGAGGVVEESIRKLPAASFILADQHLVLKNVNVAKQPASGEAARLGDDVLTSYSAVVFDFGAMTFSISP